MTDFSSFLQQGAGNPWLFIPSAILLGALHGLEPGHSKTMMAAFIVAVRGTVTQAIMLGVAATISHTAVVWLVALGGMYLGKNWDAQSSEPYFQLASGVLIVLIALWIGWRTWRQAQAAAAHMREIQEQQAAGQGYRPVHAHDHGHAHSCQHSHSHAHAHPSTSSDLLDDGSYQDAHAHAQAHAKDIRERFLNRDVTTGQIIMFGLTGGLLPCPAAITVLLLCLQLKRVALGATLVLGFSVGLALTLVFSGVVAAIGVRHASRRWSGFSEFAKHAPYFSSAVIVIVGIYVGYHGWIALP